MFKIIGSILILLNRLYMTILREQFNSYGSNFIFDPYGIYSYKAISVGSDVFIGSGAVMSATNSKIIIGNKVMFGPNVTIMGMGGDHNFSQIRKIYV